jgi:cobalamin biosynthesis protein CobW
MARLQSPDLANDFVLDATLVVVDTPRLLAGEFDRQAAGHEGMAESVGLLFDQQLAGADVVVLNKIDELCDAVLLDAEGRVRRRAPNVRFLELAYDARLDVRLALGLRLHQVTASARSHHFSGPFAPMPGAYSRPLGDHGRVDGHSHSGLLAHSHGLSTHSHFHEQDPGWLSFTLRCGQHQDAGTLRMALERAAEAEPILRCKGFALAAEGRPVLLQGVRTRVVSSTEAPKLPMNGSELVFIGYHLSRARVATMLSRLTGTAWS